MDEIYSYGLANHQYTDTIKMDPEEGVPYEPVAMAYLEYVAVKEEGRFDYINVWKNQAEDVHPPFYYLILHTICSIFPGKFSIWYAAYINIIFALLTLWAVRKLAWELTEDALFKTVVSVCFILTSGVLHICAFLRMYIVVMFWITLITYLFAKILRGGKSNNYVYICIVSVLGTLTHYYFLIYLFLYVL